MTEKLEKLLNEIKFALGYSDHGEGAERPLFVPFGSSWYEDPISE